MNGAVVEIRHNYGARQRSLALDKGSRDAMADYWRMRWPSNTAKHGAREFGLTLDQARSVVACRASLTTLDQIEKAGGWAVIFAVKALVVGQGADQFIIEMRKAHEEHGSRLAALFGDPGAGAGPAADRRSGGDRTPDHVTESAERRMGERRTR
jgi:hypothetical protein